MASSNAGLSQRIVDSGRTLVQTAFSNLASDSAIHPPFGSKHAPSGFANSLRAIIPTDFSRNASAEGFSGESFRSASGSVRRVENEYEDFVSGFASSTSSSMTGAEIIHGWLEIGEDCQVHTGWETLPAREQPIIYTHQGSLANTASTWERTSQGEVVYLPDGRPEWRWRHEWRRIDVEHTQEPRVASELAKFSSHLGIESRAPRCDQSSALARLHQVKQHLAFSPSPDGTNPWLQHWYAGRQGRCDWTQDDVFRSACDTSKEEPECYSFDCHQRGCHHTLLRINENLTSEIRQRLCVHDECSHISETAESWLRHITSPHHHQLQSEMLKDIKDDGQSRLLASQRESEADR